MGRFQEGSGMYPHAVVMRLGEMNVDPCKIRESAAGATRRLTTEGAGCRVDRGAGFAYAISAYAISNRELSLGVKGMFITVVAVLCRLGSVAAGSCVEEIVTDSNLTPDITMQQCMIGAQAPLAKWMGEHPIYRANWRIERYKCVPGHYEIKGRA